MSSNLRQTKYIDEIRRSFKVTILQWSILRIPIQCFTDPGHVQLITFELLPLFNQQLFPFLPQSTCYQRSDRGGPFQRSQLHVSFSDACPVFLYLIASFNTSCILYKCSVLLPPCVLGKQLASENHLPSKRYGREVMDPL